MSIRARAGRRSSHHLQDLRTQGVCQDLPLRLLGHPGPHAGQHPRRLGLHLSQGLSLQAQEEEGDGEGEGAQGQ